MDAAMAASKSRWYPGVNPPLRAGLPDACRTRHPRNRLLSRLLRSLLFHHLPFFSFSSTSSSTSSYTSSVTITSVPLFLVPRLRYRLCRPPLGSLLARSPPSSPFWRGPHFFWLRLRWVAPRTVCVQPMRNATVVTPLPECSDSGGLPHRLLIGVIPLSPSRSLTARLLSLAVLPRRSAAWLSSSLREPRLCYTALALLSSSVS